MIDSREHRNRRLVLGLEAAGTPEPEEALKRLTVNRIRSEAIADRTVTDVPSPLEHAGNRLRDIVATLVSGLDGAPAMAGVRGRSGSPRLMVWETDQYSFSVSFQDDRAGQLSVRGQVAPRHSDVLAVGTAELLQGDLRVQSDVTSTGQFTFNNVARESVSLEVVIGDDRVHLGPVDLRSTSS